LFEHYLKSCGKSGKSLSGLRGLWSSLQAHSSKPEGAAGTSSPRSCHRSLSPGLAEGERGKAGQGGRRLWKGAAICQAIDLDAGLTDKPWSQGISVGLVWCTPSRGLGWGQ